MKNRIGGFIIVLLLFTIFLSGCKTELKNPYKGEEMKFEVNAELLNTAQTPAGELGDERNFVVRVKLNVYNANISALEKDANKSQIMESMGNMMDVEAGTYISKFTATDPGNFQYSNKNMVYEGAVFYYTIPSEYRDEDIRVAVYNTSGGPNRELLYETKDFVKDDFDEDIYLIEEVKAKANAGTELGADSNNDTGNDTTTNNTVPDSDFNFERPVGIEYSGVASFPQAEKFTFNLILSQDKTQVLMVETHIEHIKLEIKKGNSVSTLEIGDVVISYPIKTDIQDGVIELITSDYIIRAKVLDSCIYGVASYTYNDSSESISVEMGTADIVLDNITAPEPLPEDIDSLLQTFKENIMD